MAARGGVSGSVPFMSTRGYHVPGRFMPGHQGVVVRIKLRFFPSQWSYNPLSTLKPPGALHRHSMASQGMRVGGVQHGRVTDASKKRLSDAKAKAAQQQKM